MIKTNEKVLHSSGKVTPFLKWAGGKRWLAQAHLDYFPDKYNNYIEPFLGSGSIFFNLRPKNAILSDLNHDLVKTFKALKQNWRIVYKYLLKHSSKHSQRYYYKIRGIEYRSVYKQAARFIYLNRTCWNGLYRVNREGKFNVPIGTKTGVILPNDNFQAISNLLKDTNVLNEDFEKVVNMAGKKDLIYVDPPYTVKHKNNGFLEYNEKLFSWDDQVRLRNSLIRAKRRGAIIIGTNAYHESILELYRKNFNLHILTRSSTIASNAENRGVYEEVLITSV